MPLGLWPFCNGLGRTILPKLINNDELAMMARALELED